MRVVFGPPARGCASLLAVLLGAALGTPAHAETRATDAPPGATQSAPPAATGTAPAGDYPASPAPASTVDASPDAAPPPEPTAESAPASAPASAPESDVAAPPALAGPESDDADVPPTAPAPTDAPPLAFEGALAFARPAALPTGLGVGVALTALRGDTLAFGARVAWTSATEYSASWEVTHSDLRLRALAALQHRLGRGTVGLRLGLGGTLVHETRARSQAGRAGLPDDTSRSAAWRMLPGADLTAAVAVDVAGGFGVTLDAGPSVQDDGATVRGGWLAALSARWTPGP